MTPLEQRFGDPMGPLSTASLPIDRNGKALKAPDVMVGASFVSEVIAVSQGKIAEIHAFWIPSEGNVKPPWASGRSPAREWWKGVATEAAEQGRGH